MVLIDFLICLPSEKKKKTNGTTETAKKCIYLNKTAYFNPKTYASTYFWIFK